MSIQSKTATGTVVTLTGIEDFHGPAIEVRFTHPKLGELSFRSTHYGMVQGHHGIIGHVKGQNACITVPREDFDAAMREAKAIGEREIEEFKSGAKKIQLHFSDGEYLSGYTCHGRAGDLLVQLGLAKHISGWGIHVEPKVVDSLGQTFTYADAAELARPSMEARQAKEDARQKARKDKFAQARVTGQPVVLTSWNEDCCERDYDCSLDIVTEYAMPDGSTKTERIHTH